MHRTLTHRAVLGLALVGLLAPTASSKMFQASVRVPTWVMPPGQEVVLERALDPPGARRWLVLQEAKVDSQTIAVRYGKTRDGAPALAVTLVHPSVASEQATRLKHVAVEPAPGPARERDLATLVARLKAAGDTLNVWLRIDPEPDVPVPPPEPKPRPEGEANAVQETMDRVRRLLARGDEPEVRAALSTLDISTIADGGVRLEVALLHGRLGDEEAMKAVSHTFSDDPNLGEEALFGPALRDELPAAEALFGGKSDEEICLLHRIGDVLTRAGRAQRAEALLEAILARVPTCARAAEVLGLHHLRHHDGDRAVAVMRPHHEANPKDVRLIQALSHAYRMTRRFEEAIRLFHLTADTLADDEQNQYLGQLVALYLISDTVDQWVGHWREVLSEDPNHVSGRFLLGTCLHYLDAFEESNMHLDKLVGVIDHEPRLYVYRAMNHYNLGDVDTARALLERAIKLPIIDPDVFYCRAEITRDTERDLALNDLERYLTLTGRSQFENPNKRERVLEMRDMLVACKAAGTPVCDGPWEHPRSIIIGVFKRNERPLFALGGLVLLLAGFALWRRRRSRAAP